MTGTAISLGVDGVSKPSAEPILSHSRMSPLRRNSLLHQGNLLHQGTHLHQGAHLHEEAHLHEQAQLHQGNSVDDVTEPRVVVSPTHNIELTKIQCLSNWGKMKRTKFDVRACCCMEVLFNKCL